MGMLFPRLEEFLIRVAKDGLHMAEDRASQELRAFIGQEAQHLGQHRRQLLGMRANGYRIDGIPRAFDRLIRRVERFDLPTRLAVAAAGEHFTASGAESFLRGQLLAAAPSDLRALYEWHFAEEIEHKAVLFDVMRERSVGYLRRAMGLGIAALIIPTAFAVVTMLMLAQDGALWRVSAWRELVRVFFTREGLVPLVLRAAG